MGEIVTLSDIGQTDTRLRWDNKDQAQIEAARKRFAELLSQGLEPFKGNEKGEPDEIIFDFDPEIKCIVFVPQVEGG